MIFPQMSNSKMVILVIICTQTISDKWAIGKIPKCSQTLLIFAISDDCFKGAGRRTYATPIQSITLTEPWNPNKCYDACQADGACVQYQVAMDQCHLHDDSFPASGYASSHFVAPSTCTPRP